MSYLYLARYNLNKREFDLNENLVPDTPVASALHKTLVNFNMHKRENPKENETGSEEESESVDFYIAYHPDIEFYKKHKKKAFCQYVFLRNKEAPALNLGFEEEYFLDKDFNRLEITENSNKTGKKSFVSLKPYPIIHITSLNLFDVLVQEHRYYKIPRYIRLFDSSIWNLYVPIKKEKDHDFFYRLKDNIEKVGRYHRFYHLKVILENADFRARMAYNSYLSGGDHADNVVPFLFHSETEMMTMRNENIRKVKNYAQKLRWKVLVIDDHAEAPLVGSIDIELNKSKVIKERLKEISKIIHEREEKSTGEYSDKEEEKDIFDVRSAKSIDEAKEKLKQERYDIIFLDYLLGSDGKGRRQYGYQLLKDINNNPAVWEKDKGIYGRFWFFNISSFSHTIEERLREQGLSYYSAHWNFARGASPMITPELFLYELSRFLILQIGVMTELPRSKSKKVNGQWKTMRKRLITLTDLLDEIYREQEADEMPKVSVRKRAAYFFDSVLVLKANYKILRKDLNKGSHLISSLFPDLVYYNNAFWEHLMHLVYVTAYGSVRQWPELWGEFLLIRDHLSQNGQQNDIIKQIERYIIELKGQNR